MKRKICAVVVGLILVFGLNVQPVASWGAIGHRIVGRIAHEHLRPNVHKTVRHLLDAKTMAMVANWADEVRPQRPETANWHFVDIPVTSDAYDPKRDCAPTKNGDCAIEAIRREQAALADPSQTEDRRTEALKFLVHFIGDLHQPMHCADRNDRGGNNLALTFFGNPSNLHAVWDKNIISRAGMTDAEFAEELLHNLDENDVDDFQGGTVEDWALEAHRLAVSHSYGLLPKNKKLGSFYYDNTWEMVDLQLTRAGLRLAKVLNEALK